jgi:chromosome segregation ATPase
MDTQALQLHDKVKILIEQYTLDKKKMAELESELNTKKKENASLQEQIKKLQTDLQSANSKQTNELSDLKIRNQELEKMLDSFENFADDLNTQIDDLIPRIEKI